MCNLIIQAAWHFRVHTRTPDVQSPLVAQPVTFDAATFDLG